MYQSRNSCEHTGEILRYKIPLWHKLSRRRGQVVCVWTDGSYPSSRGRRCEFEECDFEGGTDRDTNRESQPKPSNYFDYSYHYWEASFSDSSVRSKISVTRSAICAESTKR